MDEVGRHPDEQICANLLEAFRSPSGKTTRRGAIVTACPLAQILAPLTFDSEDGFPDSQSEAHPGKTPRSLGHH